MLFVRGIESFMNPDASRSCTSARKNKKCIDAAIAPIKASRRKMRIVDGMQPVRRDVAMVIASGRRLIGE
jgi:hypothetical protein